MAPDRTYIFLGNDENRRRHFGQVLLFLRDRCDFDIHQILEAAGRMSAPSAAATRGRTAMQESKGAQRHFNRAMCRRVTSLGPRLRKYRRVLSIAFNGTLLLL